MRTVWENVYENNKAYSEDAAIVFQGKKISYKTLFERTLKLASALVGSGIKCGDNIVVCSTGTPETVYLLLACSKIGVSVQMINLSLGKQAIVDSINKSSAEYIFCLDKIYGKLAVALMLTGKKIVIIPATYSLAPIIRFLAKISANDKVDYSNTIGWASFLGKSNNDYIDNEDVNRDFVTVYSSGTTGIPKGIVHTNKSYTSIYEEYRTCEYPFKRGDTFLNQIPFFIASGLSFMLFAPLMLGITIVLEPEYSAEKWVKDIYKYKPQVICATKSFWDVSIINNLFRGRDLSFLNIAVLGGEPNTPEIEEQINRVLSSCNCTTSLTVGYGMSELNGTVTTSSFKHHQIGFTGIPLPNVIVASFDVKTGRENGYLECGEIMVQSPCAMKNYANNPTLTDAFRWTDGQGNSWYRTGDIGYIDSFGEVMVLGRAVDSVDINGKTVYFFDFENLVLQIDGISACKIVADANEELIINIIVDDLRDRCNVLSDIEKITKEQLPEYVTVKNIEVWKEFPINANGKCDKDALKQGKT